MKKSKIFTFLVILSFLWLPQIAKAMQKDTAQIDILAEALKIRVDGFLKIKDNPTARKSCVEEIDTFLSNVPQDIKVDVIQKVEEPCGIMGLLPDLLDGRYYHHASYTLQPNPRSTKINDWMKPNCYSSNPKIEDQHDLEKILLKHGAIDNESSGLALGCNVAAGCRRHLNTVGTPEFELVMLGDKNYRDYLIESIKLEKQYCSHNDVAGKNMLVISRVAAYCGDSRILSAYDENAGKELAANLKRDKIIKFGLVTAGTVVIGSIIYAGFKYYKKHFEKKKKENSKKEETSSENISSN